MLGVFPRVKIMERTFNCELAEEEVTLYWDWKRSQMGMEPDTPQLGKHGCSGRGHKRCPVVAAQGAPHDYSTCPHFRPTHRPKQ